MRKFKFSIDNGTAFTVHAPKLCRYKAFLTAKGDDEVYTSVADIVSDNDEKKTIDKDYISNEFTVDDLSRFYKEFPAWLSNEKEADPN